MVSGNNVQTIIGPTKAFGLNSAILINDIKKVFNLDKSEVKWLLKGWIKTQNRGFDFNKFWQKKFSSFLGGTFSTDFLNVQPMAAPRGILWYVNPSSYGIDPARIDVLMNQPISVSSRRETFEEEVRITAEYFTADALIEENVSRMAERYANRPVNPEYYGTFTVRHEQPNFMN
jgi:hypothetical protein